MHSSRVAPTIVMASGFTSSASAVLSSPHSISKVEPSTVYNVALLAGQETEASEGIGTDMFVVVVVFANGIRVGPVEKVEDKIVVPGRVGVGLLRTVVVKPALTAEIFNATDALRKGKLVVVVRGTKMLKMLADPELTAVVAGDAILEKFAKTEGAEDEDAGFELGTTLDTSGELGGTGI